MAENLGSRKLFPTYANSSLLPKDSPYYGMKYLVGFPVKDWYDPIALTSFIGTKEVLSPQNKKVVIHYLKGFVEYPYAAQQIDGKFIVDRLIMTRADAGLLNIPNSTESTAGQIPSEINDIIWDRPLADNEVIMKYGMPASDMIVTSEEIAQKSVELVDILNICRLILEKVS